MFIWKLIIICGILSFGLTGLVRHWAIHKAILDHPNERSSHTIATPRGGGMAIAISWFIGLIILFINKEIPEPLFLALLCGLPVAVIGLLDELITTSPKGIPRRRGGAEDR